MNAPADLPVIDRSRFIGGSDAAAILGVSPWATPLDLYLIKTGQRAEVVDAQRARLFRRGKRLEPVVIDMLIEELGVQVTKRSTPEEPNRYQDPLEPYLAAEIDFEWRVTHELAERFDLPDELIGTVQNGEVKTVHPFASAKFGEADTDEIPVEYAAQAMHGLMVSGRQVTLFAVLVGADNLTPYFIRRDDETIAGMRAKELAFWHEHVLKRIPPEAVNLPDVMELFKRLPASRVVATEEIAELVTAFKANRAEINRLQAGDEEMRFQIGKFMLGENGVNRKPDGSVSPTEEVKAGTHELRFDGNVILNVVKQTQTRLDADQVKEKFPTAAAECMKSLSFFKFQSPRKKANERTRS